MVEVFRTDVCEEMRATELIELLQKHLPGSRINFDLEDRDRVLRVEGEYVEPDPVSRLLQRHGHTCEVLV